MKRKFMKRFFVFFILCFFCFSAWDAAARDCGNRTGMVRLKYFTLDDDGGRFLGLGASYFLALRHMVYNTGQLERNLDFLASQGFKYIRMLSMVGGTNDPWGGLEISPVRFTNEQGISIPPTDDYWENFGDLVDLVYSKGMRTQITIFADAKYIMPRDPDDSKRVTHIYNILNQVVAGREEKVILIEVANEFWQDIQDIPLEDLKKYGRILTAQTEVLVALSSPPGIEYLYDVNRDVEGLDIALVHFSRADAWSAIFDCSTAYPYLNGLPIKISSNEPAGPGSSLYSECDPRLLCIAPVYAWHMKLPMYVFHSRVGINGWDNVKKHCGITLNNPYSFQELFQELGLTNLFNNIQAILPCTFPNWKKVFISNELAPFSHLGSVRRCSASIAGDDFYALPFGLTGDTTLVAKRSMCSIEVYEPVSGGVTPLPGYPSSLEVGETMTLPGTAKAYIVKGQFTTD